jgi:tRNA modification GTPase
VIVTNIRHYEALVHALDSIQHVKDGLHNNISGDFLSQDIRECMHYLGEITGTISNDEILGNILLLIVKAFILSAFLFVCIIDINR